MRVLANAWWWASDYVYAGWRQACAALSFAKASDFLTGERVPVVVIPGVYEAWRFMLPLIRELHGRGHPVHVVEGLRTNLLPIDESAGIVSEYLERRGLTDVVIVAHSKGGLIGKHVMSFGDAAPRVRSMVAIATPFGGSSYANYMLGRTLRSLSPRDKLLTSIGDVLDTNSRITSVFAGFDPHIPEGSELIGAHNVRLATGGHFRILQHLDRVSRWIQ